MEQASLLNGLAFDTLPFQKDGLTAPEVDVGGGEVAQALVIALVVVVGDKGRDLSLQIARKKVVLQKDAVLQRLVPALDLALRLRVVRSAAAVRHLLIAEPGRQLARDVARSVVRQQPGSMSHLRLLEP